MKHYFSFLAIFVLAHHLFAQPTFPRNGVNDERDNFFALTHATVYTDYQNTIADATMIVRNGKIEAVGSNLKVPKGAVEINVRGKFIYPSFIDIFSDYGVPEAKRDQQNKRQGPQMESAKQGAYYWNQAVHPEVHAHDMFKTNQSRAQSLRELGFGSVSTHQQDGIVRGSGAMVLLGDGRENELIIKDQSAAYFSFNKGVSSQDYPTSLMGSIALLRQAYYDAQWYKQQGFKEEKNISLEELNSQQLLPGIFKVNGVQSLLRVNNIAKEFGTKYIIAGNGDEYQRIEEVKATGASLIIPLNFPKAFEFSDPYDAQLVTLASMMHWEMAPANAAALEKAAIPFAITLDGLKDEKQFWKNLRKAIDYGLSPKEALKGLTYTPANMLGIYNEVGSLEKGKIANFIICSDSLFSEKNIVYQNWVKGTQYILNSFNFKDIRGNYSFNVDGANLKLIIGGSAADPDASVKLNDSVKIKSTIRTIDELITLSFHYPRDTSKKTYLLSGYSKGKNFEGTGQDADGKWIRWTATFDSAYSEKRAEKKARPVVESKVLFPFEGFGNAELPKQQTYLFKNATVWTNEQEGTLLNTDVLIAEGKIKQIGKNISAPANAVTIDATGKFLTSGIIDEHSHIAATEGVNEAAQSVTAEVRIGDIINPTDINIYRQLSGGVTCSHILHGSANAIGGQTQLIKLRWGYSAEAMKFQNWPGYIKFALGENVKQSNWGDLNTVRFPQTRMGVEQTMYDAFIRAKDYKLSWDKYNGLSSKEKAKAYGPRRDLELDALMEILDQKRFITCHSYVQSEINMLMHVGDSMGFTVNTFTHILEGYKVADKMKARGINASSFSDWWAYKYEVYDAIPYNPAILTKVGVNTAVNSDDAEMARRLNQEAAKSILYGGLTEEEAWKLCTLNPAIMLRIDNRVGSIKAGKDADVVLWNNNPLSIYAKCEITLVDGIMFYNEKEEQAKVEWIQKERTRLINKMLQAKQNGEPSIKPAAIFNREWHCDSYTDGHSVGN